MQSLLEILSFALFGKNCSVDETVREEAIHLWQVYEGNVWIIEIVVAQSQIGWIPWICSRRIGQTGIERGKANGIFNGENKENNYH